MVGFDGILHTEKVEEVKMILDKLDNGKELLLDLKVN